MGDSFTPAIGDKVVIAANGITGEVIGIYNGQFDETKYLVEYADKNGAVFSYYFPASKLSAVPQPAAAADETSGTAAAPAA